MKKRILTGDRTTGRLHLGHYVGSLKNRVLLQDDYETFIILADIQAMTTHFENPALISDSILQVAIDNLSVGLNPEKTCLFRQSMIPSIAELTVFYSMLTSVNSLRHNPTIKTEMKQYGYKDISYGFLGYPVSQTADITFLNADLVPVGEDQVPHLEVARKIVRRFNQMYAGGEALIKVPEPLLSDVPRLIGLDGNTKMGKSLGNAIYLSDDTETLKQKVMKAYTDPNRIHKTDKGNPEQCAVGIYHQVFQSREGATFAEGCKQGTVGCVACKKHLVDTLDELLEPIREKRAFYEAHTSLVYDIIASGNDRANVIGNQTISNIKHAIFSNR